MPAPDSYTRRVPAQLGRLGIGMLLGSSITGAAIGLLGKEGFQVYGLVVFLTCVAVFVLIYFAESRRSEKIELRDANTARQERSFTEQKNQASLARLSGFTAHILSNATDLLFMRLQRHASTLQTSLERGDLTTVRDQVQRLPGEVARMLQTDLRSQMNGLNKNMADAATIRAVREGFEPLITRLSEMTTAPLPETEGPPEDAQPVELAPQKLPDN